MTALQVWLDALSLALYNPAAPTDSLFLKWLHRREQRFGFLPCLIFSAYNNARNGSLTRAEMTSLFLVLVARPTLEMHTLKGHLQMNECLPVGCCVSLDVEARPGRGKEGSLHNTT